MPEAGLRMVVLLTSLKDERPPSFESVFEFRNMLWLSRWCWGCGWMLLFVTENMVLLFRLGALDVCDFLIRLSTPSISMSFKGVSPFLLKNSERVSFGFLDVYERFDWRERSIADTLTFSNGCFFFVCRCCPCVPLAMGSLFFTLFGWLKKPLIFWNRFPDFCVGT